MDTVFLVGGFGGCTYTHEKISAMLENKFPKRKLRVFVPTHHELAVALGAVKYRLKPDVFCSHIMDASYGTNIAPVFNSVLHRHEKRLLAMDSTGTVRSVNVYFQDLKKSGKFKDFSPLLK